MRLVWKVQANFDKKDGEKMTKRILAVLMTLSLMMVGLAPTAMSQQVAGEGESQNQGQQTNVNKLVEPSMVKLVIGWEGYIQYIDDTKKLVWSDPIATWTGCSGFFVSESGHVVTAGHCVDPAQGREALITKFLNGWINKGKLTPEEAAVIRERDSSGWKVEGYTAGNPITQKVLVSQASNLEGAVIKDSDGLVAQVLDFKAFSKGDVAVLKVEVKNAPPLAVATTDPVSGAQITAVGFPGSVRSVSDAKKTQASFKTGTVSSQQIRSNGIANIEINAEVSEGMSGGPTVDMGGNAIGVNSYGPRGETQAFNFVTDTTDLRDFLTRNNVPLAPPKAVVGSADKASSSPLGGGLAAEDLSEESSFPWWILVVLSALLVLGAVALVIRRKARQNKRQPELNAFGTPYPPQGGVGTVETVRPCCRTSAKSGANFCSQCGSSLTES